MMQDGVTATNPQTGEKVVLRGGQWVPLGQSAPAPAPVAPDRIYGAPKAPDPVEAARLDIARQAEARAQASSAAELENKRLQNRKLQQDLANPDGGEDANGQKLTARKAALDSLVGQINRVQSLYEQNVRGSDDAFLEGGIDRLGVTLGMGWAAPTSENKQFDDAAAGLAEQGLSAFRVPGVGAQSDAELRQFAQANRPSSSDFNSSIEEKLRQLRSRVDESRKSLGLPPAQWQGGASTTPGGGPPAGGPDKPKMPHGEAFSLEGLIDRASGLKPVAWEPIGPGGQIRLRYADGHTEDVEIRDEAFLNGDDYRAAYRSKFGEDPGLSVFVSGGEEPADAPAQPLPDRSDSGLDATVRGLADTGAFGMADEIAAGLDTLFVGGTMKDNLQRERAIDAADTKQNFPQRFGGQIAGGFLNPVGRGATTPAQIARAGALGGGLYGFGSGTDPQSRGANALLGAGGGAVGGYAIGKGVNALSPAVRRAFGTSRASLRRADEMAIANDVASAAEAEGVTVSRAVLDPASRNKVTALETMPGSGEVVREGLDATREGLRAGVERLGQGGTARDSYGMGETIQQAGRDFIKRSGAVSRRLYDRAERLGGSTPINPANALKAIRDNIMELRATPEANRGLISYLESLGEDISGGITVSGLRNLRTQMRGQISERNLTMSDAERRVIGVLDAASDDIANAFKDNPAAANAYARADRLYREKQTYIKDVVQKFIGKREGGISAEDAWRKFEGMAHDKDSRRMAEMMRALDPDEARDVAATFAEQLGRNNAGEFTAAQLVSQAEKLSDRAKLTIFGPQGKQSLDNLVKVARELRATEANLNRSRTGVANNYRSWLSNVIGLVGAGGGAGVGSAGGIAGAGVGAMLGGAASKVVAEKAEGALQAMSAKALMSPEITKWLSSAPRTSDPAAIDAHIRRLGTIAARNPQLAEGVAAIERRIAEAVALLPQRSTAQGQEPKKP